MSRFFRTGDTTSSSDQTSASSGSDSDDNKVTTKDVRGLLSSSSDEESNRVIRSQKDKQFAELQKLTLVIYEDLEDDDWDNMIDDFKALQLQLHKSIQVIKQHGFPRFYLKCVLDIDTAAKEVDAASLPRDDQRAHREMVQRVRKHIEQFQAQFNQYLNNPSDDEDEDDDDDDSVEVTAKPASRRVPESDDDDDEDDDDEDDDDDDVKGGDAGNKAQEESASSDLDDDIDDVSKLGGKITRDFWLKKEPKEQPQQQQTRAQRRPREARQKADLLDEHGNFLTRAQKQRLELAKARANEEVTPAVMNRKLRDIVASRGKRSVNHQETLNELRFLETKCEDNATLLRVRSLLVLCSFDAYTLRGAVLQLSHWRECLSLIHTVLDTLETDNTIRLTEDHGFDDDSFLVQHHDEDVTNAVKQADGSGEQANWFQSRMRVLQEARQNALEDQRKLQEEQELSGITFIEGNLYSYLFRISDEYYKALQSIDYNTLEYINRLREQPNLLELLERASQYYLKIQKTRLYTRTVELVLEYKYYYYDADYDVILHPQQVNAVTSVDKLVEILLASEDPRSRIRALLFQLYHWAVHGKYEQAKERLLMSYISETINDLDILTRILYNRTIAQLGIAAFRIGDYRGALNALGDLYNRSVRIRELLAQGFVTRPDGKDEEVNEAKRRVYPYHMHINLDLLDAIHLISGAVIEIPNITESGLNRRVVSKFFRRRYHDYIQHNSNLSHNLSSIDSARDAILVAAHHMSQGTWDVSWDLLKGLKMWNNVHQATAVQATLLDSVKSQALKCYLLTVGNAYTCVNLEVLVDLFQLPESTVVKIASTYAFNETIHAAWSHNIDNKPCLVLSHHSTPTSHKGASQFFDKLQTLNNTITSASRYK